MASVDEEYLNGFASMVAGGLSAEATRNFFMNKMAMPKEIANSLWLEFERRAGLIRIQPDPGAVAEPVAIGEAWYVGPNADDKFWPAMRERLRKGLPEEVVDSVDVASNKILSLMKPPGSEAFSSRGLVVGNVQSGKTTSFMSVIAKAADRGYRVFIVLSGITNNLRDQTQDRVDAMLIGDNKTMWVKLTTMGFDFNEDPTNAAALLGQPGLRFIAVVKKNPSRLRALHAWLKAAGPTVLETAPVVIIDDEADQASINVAKGSRDSTINGLMKKILDQPKVAYLAYTATPFANLLIDPKSEQDLYPRDFIVALTQSDDYFGPERIFGRIERLDIDDPGTDGLDVVRTINDVEATALRPPRGGGGAGWTPPIEAALEEAICWFILSTAARRARGGGNPHATMLVHTSMLAQAHFAVANAIKAYIEDFRGRLAKEDALLLGSLRAQWNGEACRLPSSTFGHTPLAFSIVSEQIPAVVDELHVIVDNYQSVDRLNYSTTDRTTAIVIGGNTLSRGLTLEGLSTSYFVRSSTAYDTLLQMGRWFGYRVGYEDLCRIWMTNELSRWFRDLSLVELEIREEIRRYEYEHLSPSKVGVRIRLHPSMEVTSAAKRRNAVVEHMSFSQLHPQTIKFFRNDESWLQQNIQAVKSMVKDVQKRGSAELPFRGGNRGFRDVDFTSILTLIENYNFHPQAASTSPKLLSAYIRKETASGALLKWNIVVMSTSRPWENGDAGHTIDLGLEDETRMLNRSPLRTMDPDEAYFKAIVSVADRIADLDVSVQEAIPSTGQKGQKPVSDLELLTYRESRGDLNQALLCIYPIDPRSRPENAGRAGSLREDLNSAAPIVGLAFFFPKASGPNSTVEYFVADFEPAEEDTFDDDALEATAADEADEAQVKVEIQTRVLK